MIASMVLLAGVTVATSWDGKAPVPEFVMRDARILRECVMSDPHRPLYHFTMLDGDAMPGDSNGAFWANGRYHLFYLYARPEGAAQCENRIVNRSFSWGHVSSADLLHWRHHPDAIGPEGGDGGAFSGGGFVDDDGKAYLTYWMLWGNRGIGLVESTDPNYVGWKRSAANPVIRSDVDFGVSSLKGADGKPFLVGSADPSNIWKKDGKYYMLTGNKPVLDRCGRKPDSEPRYRGDHLYLFESADLKEWTYRHEFYARRAEESRATGWTDADEDNMCPVFLPLPSSPAGGAASGKWLLTFISHNRGCQYYIGAYDTANDRFLPESHGRMTWNDSAYFAPEALMDGKGRQLLWTWFRDGHALEPSGCGWRGVYGLPRSLYLRTDGTLGIAVPEEFRKLRLGEAALGAVTLADGEMREVKGVPGDLCELSVKVSSATAAAAEIRVRASADGKSAAIIRYDATKKELVCDTRTCGNDGWRIEERAPFSLAPGEDLELDVFIDRSVIEVFANGRQAISRRVFPAATASHVLLGAKGGKAEYRSVTAWEMDATNPY